MTTLFGTDAVSAVAAIDVPAAPRKRGWLPLLTLLFLISYGLMTMLIVEQGRTIESQRALIRELFRDSKELSAARKTLQDRALPAQTQSAETLAAPPQAQSNRTQSKPAPSTQIHQYPSAQAPSIQAPSAQTQNQAGPPQQQRAQSQSAKQKPDFKMPSKPEPDLVDDVRTLSTI